MSYEWSCLLLYRLIMTRLGVVHLTQATYSGVLLSTNMLYYSNIDHLIEGHRPIVCMHMKHGTYVIYPWITARAPTFGRCPTQQQPAAVAKWHVDHLLSRFLYAGRLKPGMGALRYASAAAWCLAAGQPDPGPVPDPPMDGQLELASSSCLV